MATTNRNTMAPIHADDVAELERTRILATRYRCAFVDLREQRIDPELFRSIPAELMLSLIHI